MNQTTKETRRRSYDAVLPKRAARCRLILETLGNRELTASEITEPARSPRSSSQPAGSRTSTATTSPRGSQS